MTRKIREELFMRFQQELGGTFSLAVCNCGVVVRDRFHQTFELLQSLQGRMSISLLGETEKNLEIRELRPLEFDDPEVWRVYLLDTLAGAIYQTQFNPDSFLEGGEIAYVVLMDFVQVKNYFAKDESLFTNKYMFYSSFIQL